MKEKSIFCPCSTQRVRIFSQTLNTLVANSSVAGARPSGGTPGALGTSVDQVFEGPLRMTCDEATNSLVTTSSLRDYARLRTVIEKLDHPRRQVFIEAVIMNVNIDRETDWGVASHGGAPLSVANGQGLFWGGNNPAVSMSSVPKTLKPWPSVCADPTFQNHELLGTGISIPALRCGARCTGKRRRHQYHGDSAPPCDGQHQSPNIHRQKYSPSDQRRWRPIGPGKPSHGCDWRDGGLGGLGLLGGGFRRRGRTSEAKVTVVPHVNDSEQVRLELTEEISEQGSPLGPWAPSQSPSVPPQPRSLFVTSETVE